MNAAILAIGDELVSGLTADRNANWLAQRLFERGVAVIEIRLLGDDRAATARAIAALAAQVDLLLITGGLGPTDDDLTREALGDVLTPGEPLETDPNALRAIERRFAATGRPMPGNNARQALRPRGAVLIDNPHGTAPGIRAVRGGCTIIVMPGVPVEMKPMFDLVAATLNFPARSARYRSLNTFGIGESDLAGRLGPILARDQPLRIGTTSGAGGVAIRIYGSGAPGEDAAIEAILHQCETIAQPYAFGRDDETLAGALGRLLCARNPGRPMMLATAESCTGGGLGAMLTAEPGASAWYCGGWVTYSNEMKRSCLGVDAALIERCGAVSREVAAAMAHGACLRSGADLALSITGIAGPDGGTSDKPVGAVFIGLHAAAENRSIVRHFNFRGDRDGVRERSARTAVQMARFHLLGVDEDVVMLGERPAQAAAR